MYSLRIYTELLAWLLALGLAQHKACYANTGDSQPTVVDYRLLQIGDSRPPRAREAAL